MFLKVGIHKVFGIMSWDFILLALQTVEVPDKMFLCIETCLTTPHFLVKLNKELQSFFS